MKSDYADILIASSNPAAYPKGAEGAVFGDRRSRPTALLIGTLALRGSQEPWKLPQQMKTRLSIDILKPDTLLEAGRQAITDTCIGLHRSPYDMGKWICGSAAHIKAHFGGETSWLWNNGLGIRASHLMARLMALSGIGQSKALSLLNILNRDWGVRITEWDSLKLTMSGPMLRTASRIGLIERSENSKELVAIYEGIRNIASDYCFDEPDCEVCPLDMVCPKYGRLK